MKHEASELLYQWYETELGGVQIYKNALKCAQDKDLKKEWTKYLAQTKRHCRIVAGSLQQLGFDPDKETAGRKVVRHLGESYVKAMQMSLRAGVPKAAELVAAECVVLAETKDHLNWHLIGELAAKETGEAKAILNSAIKEVEDEEDEHLYHTKGWTRQLWFNSLGMSAVLPPPEERKNVKTPIAAALAEKARAQMI